MSLDISDVKLGLILSWNGEPYQVIWSNRMRTAQRKPVMQTKLKHLISGKVIEYSFKFGEKVDEADVTRERANFLYADEAGTHYMNQQTFETIDMNKEDTSEQEKYLKENMEVMILRYNGNPVSIEIPVKVELKVVDAPPNVTGNSGGSVTKPVTLETGLVVQVPMFIKEGDMLSIDTRDGAYVSRASN
ncbi:MAG: elongation factor [Candidatus Doudnabacteria bacterium]|nr:elongation factor [Candidatus Doudnabacteria bacterium]